MERFPWFVVYLTILKLKIQKYLSIVSYKDKLCFYCAKFSNKLKAKMELFSHCKADEGTLNFSKKKILRTKMKNKI